MRLVLLLLFAALASRASGDTIITYPYQEFPDGYPVALLKLALKKSRPNEEFRLTESGINVQQGRSLKLLEKNIEVDVVWTMTNNEREQTLRAIKIPIYKGMYGYRIFLIHKDNQNAFTPNMTFEQLQTERVAVQGNDWPDTRVMQHNQLTVQGIEIYDAMFELIQKRRADYFPRSILEIWREEREHQGQDLQVEQHLAFYYPAYIYFFVSKTNIELGDAIEQGLLMAIEDGSFDILFETIEDKSIEKSQLSKRRVFHLNNPNVSVEGVYPWPSLLTD